jgi:Flp pilus assembly protein TadB
MTGTVLSALPVVLTLAMFAVNPEYIAGLFAHPAGRLMVSAAVIANVAAHFIIKKLSQVRM